MTGLAIKFNGVFTDEDLPKLKYDDLLTDAEGSLLLIDVRNWASGVPSHGNLFANLAREQLALAEVTGDSSARMFKIGDLSGTKGTIERSGKGGLHVIVTQASDPGIDQGYGVLMPANVIAYMCANPTHHYYFSLWHKLTRIASAASNNARNVATMEKAGSGVPAFMRLADSASQTVPSSGSRDGYRAAPGSNTVGDIFRNLAGVGNNLAGPPVPADFPDPQAAVAQFGTVRPQNASSVNRATLQSWIFYRAYLEDLTLSGRSYATVDALDYAMYQEAFAVDGRFYGDTFTAPSTIP